MFNRFLSRFQPDGFRSDPDPDAVMRLGGETHGSGPILPVGVFAMSAAGSRHLGSSIGSPPESQRERRVGPE
jgi:hypothetical protein